jgi:hypothetical protein
VSRPGGGEGVGEVSELRDSLSPAGHYLLLLVCVCVCVWLCVWCVCVWLCLVRVYDWCVCASLSQSVCESAHMTSQLKSHKLHERYSIPLVLLSASPDSFKSVLSVD